MAQCFAYDPAGPNLYVLNSTTWLILLLCAGAGRDAIAAGYHAQVEPMLTRAEAAAQTDRALADLLALGLIQAEPSTDRRSAA